MLKYTFCFILAPTFSEGDMSYCFATCDDGIVNAAPGGEADGELQLGQFTCNPEQGGLHSDNFVASNQWITLPKSIKTGSLPEGEKTAAILIKHAAPYQYGQRTPREFKQQNSWALNSEPWPAARSSVYNGGWCDVGPFPDVFSKTEFVLVAVTYNTTTGTMYRNSVKLGHKTCNKLPASSDYPFQLGENHLAGTIKSFAVWNRALSEEEITSIDPTKLTCGTEGNYYSPIAVYFLV